MASDHASTVELLRSRLASLNPENIEIIDDSHRHAGHAGAREGGHFTLSISSAEFVGQSKLQRQRTVLNLLGDLRAIGVHALSITASDPKLK